MNKFIPILLALYSFSVKAQPILVNNSIYSRVNCIGYDSSSNKIYYNITNGCPAWDVPCALNYSVFGQHNLVNQHDFSDNTVSTVMASKYQVATPDFPVNNYNSAYARQCVCTEGSIYTNFGYYFNKISADLALPGATWSYSPAANPSYKEISTFEVKGDSVFLFQKDSISSKNYYNVLLRHKLNGAVIPYNSLVESNPNNSAGAIEGYIHTSVMSGNKIILAGAFTASVSGAFLCRNVVVFDPSTGQLQASPLSFSAGSIVYDMQKHNGKIYIAGRFTDINGLARINFAALDANCNLLNETCQFSGNPGSWVDKIVFYDHYLIAKGYYSNANGSQFSLSNIYTVKTIDYSNGMLTPWVITIPGFPLSPNNTFQMYKNKLYIKNREASGSPFHIYCFEPVTLSSRIFYPGSSLPNPSPSVSLCAPDNGDACVFVSPLRYAETYNWTYSGSNATVVPVGNGSSGKLITAVNSTSGTLSVTGYNDCSLSSSTATLQVIIQQKPVFVLPASPQTIICNPDSTLLQTTSNNTATTIYWRNSNATVTVSQPFYTKTAGTYYSVITDNLNGCKDSGSVIVSANKILPNAKLLSHAYAGALIPTDTVTCYQPAVNILAGSDTAGVNISWKNIADNSVLSNPVSVTAQTNFKVIVSRNMNNCVDSSLIVLVGQDNAKPVLSLNQPTVNLNCSVYSASLNAVASPSSCLVTWTGSGGFNSVNPALATVAGKYIVSANNPINGCIKQDSVIVSYSNVFLLKSSNDTTVCKQSPVTLSSSALGTLSGISYVWNTGVAGNSIAVNSSVTTHYIVSADGPGGCSGTDTIKVIIPKDIADSTLAYRNCDDESTGSIVIFAKGGIPPYQYSINNGISFQTANSFSALPFGNYPVVIKDAIGCQLNRSVLLSSSSDLPTPKFLASTSNFRTDTIVIVDISVPKADSVKWLLPAQCTIIGGSMFTPIIANSDTGTFVITMRSYYGDCILNTSKTIRFSKADSLAANHYNAKGIKSFSLYPNPNTGQFTIAVEFYKPQNASVQVWDASPYKHLQENFYNVSIIELPVNLSQLQNGSYIARVIGEYNAGHVQFIMNK